MFKMSAKFFQFALPQLGMVFGDADKNIFDMTLGTLLVIGL